jgi:RNA polymerase sigma-70 factor (ECF subfamily)
VDDQHFSLLSDAELVYRVCEREVNAFTALYDRYARPIYILAVHMLDPAEAEEVVQEVFLRLWTKADQFQIERGSFYTWFMAIARHNVLDRLRRLSKQQRLILAVEIEQTLVEAMDPTIDVEEEAWKQDLGRILIQELADLPEEQRHALILAYFSGLSQSAIASRLDWPLGTVKKRIRLGLQKLRKALIKRGVESGGHSYPSTPPPRIEKEGEGNRKNKSRWKW